jgi:general secretion pathway protein A
MYTAHFGLKIAPFSITPDPHFLYLSICHREALAHLLYGVNEGPGFVLLTGEVGTGKTTICRSMIEQLPDTVDVALLLNPRLTAIELLAALFDELRISYDPQHYTLKDFTDALTSYLLTAHYVGRRTVLIIDEAQNLSAEVLEQVRLLTNLETSNQKLLQIILVAQPELHKLLNQDNLRQLSQRITARHHLTPLSAKETTAYINHRLTISGASSPIFTDAAMRLIYRYSAGIPRMINIICDRALLGGYVNNKKLINAKIVHKAEQEVRGEKPINQQRLVTIGIILIFIVALLWWWKSPNPTPTPKSTTDNTVTVEPATSSEPSLPSNNPPVSTPLPKPAPSNVRKIAPPPNLIKQLQATTTENAFATLFSLWGLDYNSLTGENVCQRAATQKLACLIRTGTWDKLRRFNRPAVIELVTDKGKRYHVVVTHLQDEIATLAISGKRFEFPLSEINQYWLGQFLLLWQPPMLPVRPLKVGASNKAVIWIRKQLDIIQGDNSEHFSKNFNYMLKERIIAFQRLYALNPDGVVGEQTMLILQAFSDKGPLLASPAP